MNDALNRLRTLPRPSGATRVTVPRVTGTVSTNPPGPATDAAGWTVVGRSGEDAFVRFRHHSPDAGTVAVSVSGWAYPDPPEACDLESVGDGWWEAVFRVPDDWQASYSFVEDGQPLRSRPRIVAGHPGLSTTVVPEVVRVRDAGPWVHGYGRPDAEVVTSVPGPVGTGEPAVRLWRSSSGESGNPVPLVVVFDGEAHVDRLGTSGMFAAARECGVIPDIAVAFVDSGPDRAGVLGVPGGTAQWVADTLVPRLHRDGVSGPVSDDRTIVSGSSFGGLSALFALAGSRDIAAAVAQSVSYWRYPTPDLDLAITSALRQRPDADRATVRLHAGRYEGDSPVRSGELARRLAAEGHDAVSRTVTGGHDWAWWLPEMITEIGDLLSDLPRDLPGGPTR